MYYGVYILVCAIINLSNCTPKTINSIKLLLTHALTSIVKWSDGVQTCDIASRT